MPRTILSALMLTATALVAGCTQEPALTVDEGWVRLSAVPDRPAAAYFTLHGGETDTRLLSVTTNVAIRSEIHETMNEGGMMKMTPLDGLDVPANSEIKFAPGGKHVMLFNVNPGIKPNDRMELVFTFANGERLAYEAIVRAADGGAPAKN
jgi:copper(I)-binding protein